MELTFFHKAGIIILGIVFLLLVIKAVWLVFRFVKDQAEEEDS
jgi:hypothetical protein